LLTIKGPNILVGDVTTLGNATVDGATVDGDMVEAASFDVAIPMGSVGMVLPVGLDEATLTGDLSVRSSAELVYQAFPGPGTLALLAIVLVGLLVARRRMKMPKR